MQGLVKLVTKCAIKTFSNEMIASMVNSKIMGAYMKLFTKCAIKTFPEIMIASLMNSKNI